MQRMFKDNHSFEKRYAESKKIMVKYPGRIPIICERDPKSQDVPDIDRKKYLTPSDLSIANFMYVIRNRLKLSCEKSIYLFVDNIVMPATSQLLSTIYNEYSDDDGFLYIRYAGESTFGGDLENK
uniref:Autophagy-related protein n=1 Tax=viral metagenome TaxID=1070528 RepID=A0A6C0LJA3_9ZZZZ